MNKFTRKVLVGFVAISFIPASYAIEVNVHTTAEKVNGIGFAVNGSKHGGLGKTYQGSDMPAGMYSFGVRVDDKDVPCLARGGKKKIKLTADTDAELTYNGKHCTVATR